MATFLALIEGLIGDPAEKAAYAADPDNYLSSHGFGDLDDEDIRTALSHSADSFPPRLAAVIDPDAGLAPVADVELGQLGLSSFDEYAPPLDDDVGGPDEVERAGADELAERAVDDDDDDEDRSPGLHRDVDIDLDGDGIPDARDVPARADVGRAADVTDEVDRADDADEADDQAPAPFDLIDDDDAPAPAFVAAADPFNDPWADPGLHLDDDAPWMDSGPGDGDLEPVDEPDDDILDDVDEHMGQS
jgi:hypothetical protein